VLRDAAGRAAPSRAIARQLANGIRADYANVLPSALTCFEDDFEACIAHLRLPVTHRRFVRTTNLLERLFVEEQIIPNGFGEKPVLKLMFGALIRAAERWRGLRFTEFALRHIAAVRKDSSTNIRPRSRRWQGHPNAVFQQIQALTIRSHPRRRIICLHQRLQRLKSVIMCNGHQVASINLERFPAGLNRLVVGVPNALKM
jgi:Transposase, Mutator family